MGRSSPVIALLACLMTSCSAGCMSNSTLPQACPGVNITNLDDLQRQFLNLKAGREAYVIKFSLVFAPDVSYSRVQGTDSTSDSFDSKSWLWISEYGGYVLDLPLDYRFVSLGLLTLQEYTLEVLIQDPGGCLTNSTTTLHNHLIQQTLADIIWYNDKVIQIPYNMGASKEYLCRSVYAYPSFINPEAGHLKLVGWRCVGAMEHSKDPCSQGMVLKQVNEHHQRAMITFVILLSIGLYIKLYTSRRITIIGYAWRGRCWDWLGHYYGYSPSHYRTYILDIGGQDVKRWVHVNDDDLMRGDGRVSAGEVGEILGASFHTSRCLILCKFFLLLLTFTVVSVIIIPLVYMPYVGTIDFLRDGEEVSLNLRSVPLAWWKTNPDFWPYNFGLFILASVFISLAIEFIIVLTFVIGFHKGPPKDFEHYLVDVDKKDKREEKYSALGLVLAVIFQLIDVCLGIGIVAGVIYPFIQAIAHVCLAVIVYIHLLTPWLVAIAMTLFHIYGNIQHFSQPYIDVKEIIQAEILESKDTIQAYTVWNVFKNKSIRAFKSITDGDETDSEKTEKTVNRIQKLPPRLLGSLLVSFQHEKRPTLLTEHYNKMCRYLIHSGRSLWTFVVRMVLFLVYLAVILTSMTLYRSSMTGDRSSEGLVKGAVLFVFLLLPQLYTLQHRRYKSMTSRMIWRLEVQRYLRSLATEWDGELDSSKAKNRSTFRQKRRKERWSVILDDDDVNPDPPLEFPERSPGDCEVVMVPELEGWNTKLSNHDDEVFEMRPEGSVEGSTYGGSFGGSEPIINPNPTTQLKLSMSNISNFSSTTT